jgi:hypothetical protein
MSERLTAAEVATICDGIAPHADVYSIHFRMLAENVRNSAC